MDIFKIIGENRLSGSVNISGSKNAALPILFSTLLSGDSHTIRSVPNLRDMDSTMKMLLFLGAKVNIKHDSAWGSEWSIDHKDINPDAFAPYDLVRKMRASTLVLGPLLARFGRAKVSLPGGCAIGSRPIDIHLESLKKLGATIIQEGGYIKANGQLKGNKIIFPFPSVGATQNIVMAATLAKGQTEIVNVAREPEIVAFVKSLKSMGAQIEGEGSNKILIQGVDELKAATMTIPSDRIEAATYMILTQMVGGEVDVNNVCLEDHDWLMSSLEKTGAKIERAQNSLKIQSSEVIQPLDQETAPYPAFATDIQAQWMALMTQANGDSMVTENIFENRFMHVPELKRLGAQMKVSGRNVTIKGLGRGSLMGADVMATDLRASASLILGALAAKGETEIKRIYHLDRGYESMELKLRSLGAQVERDSE